MDRLLKVPKLSKCGVSKEFNFPDFALCKRD